MEIKSLNKDKPEGVILQVHSGEASSSIPLGTPVVLTLDGTNDGLDVVLPGSEALLANSMLFGVATETITAGAYGTVQCFGFCRNNVLRQRTRAGTSGTSNTWASVASLAKGHMLAIDTVNNAFSTMSASMAASMFLPFAILAESVASVASGVSDSTLHSGTALTTSVKTFIRAM